MPRETAARTARSEQKARTRARLLEAALATLIDSGPDGFSMHKVARRAGIAQPTFYVHFDSLEALFSELARDVGGRFITPLREEMVAFVLRMPRSELRPLVRRLLEGAFELVRSQRALCEMLWAERVRPNSPLGVSLRNVYECNTQAWVVSFGKMGFPVDTDEGRTRVLMFFDALSASFEALALQWPSGRYTGTRHPADMLTDWIMLYWSEDLDRLFAASERA